MLPRDDLWLVEELPIDEPADPLTIPEIKRHVVHEPHDEELGLRSLLERPEALSKAWWCEESARPPRPIHKSAKRHSAVLRVA